MLQFEKYGRPMTTDRRELAEAFAALRLTASKIETDPDAAAKEIAEGLHPAAGQPWLKAGSWIAARLAGDEAIRYHRLGELALLEDYIALYRRDRSIPRAYRLPRAFERRILALADDWESVFTPEVAAMVVEGPAAADRFADTMSGRRARILPSLANELVAAVETAFQRGDVQRAGRLAAMAAELYPEDAEATGIQGVVLSLTGKQDEGFTLLRKSAALDARGYARAGNLRGIADFVGSEGMSEAAIVLLENTAAVHPDDARTHLALGDAYAAEGKTEQAKRAYERALALDPESEQARKGLGRIGE